MMDLWKLRSVQQQWFRGLKQQQQKMKPDWLKYVFLCFGQSGCNIYFDFLIFFIFNGIYNALRCPSLSFGQNGWRSCFDIALPTDSHIISTTLWVEVVFRHSPTDWSAHYLYNPLGGGLAAIGSSWSLYQYSLYTKSYIKHESKPPQRNNDL